MVLKLYGVPASQPVRSVKWLLEMKNAQYEFVNVNPGSPKSGGTRSAEYLAKSPAGLIPLIEEDDGFLLWESHAIMAYLCNKNGWDDLYPSDPKARGIVDQWLHWHHTNVRKFTMALFAPVFRPDLKIPAEQQKADMKVLNNTCRILDDQLARFKFVAGDNVTIADVAFYGELGQMQEHYVGAFDFSPYKNLQAWLTRMATLPKYEEVNYTLLVKLGKVYQKLKAKKANL
mmetsp:Transcript_6588/g.8364  ORF Transcript_6588/g.8364 Transcript_6588/m.8364 type:complete len:230 (+) Transcript_6588:140-829(+)